MNKVLPLCLRWAYFIVVLVCATYLAGRILQRTPWYKEQLYSQLVTGDHHQRVRAAAALARLGGQDQLLDALKVEGAAVRETAQQALEHLWFTSAGNEAYRLTQAAACAVDEEEFEEALKILNQITQRFPTYAEGWNRRASLHWQLGQYNKSIQDCERALSLNPNHYGAWQGMGVCQLEIGKVSEACQALREAVKILPYDEPTRRSLRRCESLLRIYPHPTQAVSVGALL